MSRFDASQDVSVLAAVRLGASGSYLCRIAARTQTYWQKHLGAARPEPIRVLDILELQSHWSGEGDDGIETFDFTLPEGVTNYVISVHFNESGQVDEITMES